MSRLLLLLAKSLADSLRHNQKDAVSKAFAASKKTRADCHARYRDAPK